MGLLDIFRRKKSDFKMHILHDILYYKDHESLEEVHLQKLKYAYANRLQADDLYLVLFDERLHYIKSSQPGFQSCYEILIKEFGFDNVEFSRIAKSRKESKSRIYLKNTPQNYSVDTLSETNIQDGLYVLNDTPHYISWDTTYAEFKKLSVGHIYHEDNGLSYFRFDSPVKLGSIIFYGLEFYIEDSLPDLPVQSYFIDLYHSNNSDQSYEDVKQSWKNYLPKDIDKVGYERNDQKHLSITIADIQLEITYNYAVKNNYDQGCAFFYIKNKRDYTALVLKDAPSLASQSIEYLNFDTDLEFIPDYKNSPNVVRRPEFIPEQFVSVIWYDKANNRFGFTNHKYSIVYQVKDVEHIIIQNVLPAKGAGYAVLSIQPTNGFPQTIYYAEQNYFDPYIEQMKSSGMFNVIVPEPYYNC